jgi:DNA-binding MarR family transcriptional regulator
MLAIMIDPLSYLPGYVLRRASLATMGRLHTHLAPHGLRATEASLILLIGERSGLTQSDAGRILGIKRANMAPLTAKLELRGLVRRVQLNGRSQELALTPEGTLMLEKVRSVIDMHEAETMARLPADLRPYVIPILAAIWGPDSQES